MGPKKTVRSRAGEITPLVEVKWGPSETLYRGNRVAPFITGDRAHLVLRVTIRMSEFEMIVTVISTNCCCSGLRYISMNICGRLGTI